MDVGELLLGGELGEGFECVVGGGAGEVLQETAVDMFACHWGLGCMSRHLCVNQDELSDFFGRRRGAVGPFRRR